MSKKIVFAASLLLSLQAGSVLAAELGKGSRAFDSKDYNTAMTELAPLAAEGNPDALNMVGQMYENGWGVKADEGRARKLYDQGAAQGHLGSVNSLRRLKNREYLVELKTVEPGAQNGSATDQNRLGEMYEFGQGVKRNPQEAFRWYQTAARQGLVSAQHNLARSYNFGTGVAQDFGTAEQWYLKAADQGYTQSMFFLGTMYSNNLGADQSRDHNITAYAWMHNAALLGNDTASAIERRLRMKLNASEQRSADALADELKARYVTPYQ
ncbi:MAG: sel1 repeat family protein [Marinobacterium sp.]|nr:sel1 repeat family protein [Marinobacterium sp.]